MREFDVDETPMLIAAKRLMGVTSVNKRIELGLSKKDAELCSDFYDLFVMEDGDD